MSGCQSEPPEPDPEPVTFVLASVDGWERVADVEQDVFGSERPEDLECDEVMGLVPEYVGPDPVFEVKTDLCNYLTARQASLQALAVGDTIAIRMFHWDLVADVAAQAHLAIAIDGEVAWEHWVPIPSGVGLVEGEVVVDRALPAGTELQFHVHNHGINSYDIYDLRATSFPTE